MGTSAIIAQQISPEEIRVIRLNGDGYTRFAGNKLRQVYDTPEKINDLMDLGDLSILGDDLFESIAYHRDRNESWSRVKPRIYQRMPFMVNNESGDFIYVFDGVEWTAYNHNGSEQYVIGGKTLRE